MKDGPNPNSTPASPLPWRIAEEGPWGVIPIFAEGKPVVCIVRYSDNPNLGEAEGWANARLIEKSVNAYSKLVEALKLTAAALDAYMAPNPSSPYKNGLPPFYVMGAKEVLDSAQSTLKDLGEL